MSAQDLEFTHKLADAADKISMARFGAIDLKIETKPDLKSYVSFYVMA